MLESIVKASLGDVYYLHLSPHEDLYESMLAAIKKQQLSCGVVLSITGALEYTCLSTPVDSGGVDAPPGFLEVAGTAEVSGTGYFGRTAESWSSPTSMISYQAGDPFLHVHLTAALHGGTYAGHLISGCRVRSLAPSSHFIVVMAEVPGVALSYRRTLETPEGYPNGVPFYNLLPAGDRIGEPA